MKTLFLPIGMQGAGKTTWAKELCTKMNKRGSNQNLVLISRDDYRAMLAGGIENYHYGTKFSSTVEGMITQAQMHQAELAVQNGLSIVIADMNLNPKTQTMWRNFAKKHSYHVHERNFYQEYLAENNKKDILVNEAEYLEMLIRRDLQRPNSVGPKVLTETFNRYLRCDLHQHVHVEGLPKAFIVDVDGTVCHMDGRKAWEWKRVGEDKLDVHVAQMVRDLKAQGYIIIVMSGRSEVCKVDTVKYFQDNNIPLDYIFMRAADDHRKDSVTKNELFENNVQGKFNVHGAFDDRDQVVSLWRRKGIKCYQVEYGDF